MRTSLRRAAHAYRQQSEFASASTLFLRGPRRVAAVRPRILLHIALLCSALSFVVPASAQSLHNNASMNAARLAANDSASDSIAPNSIAPNSNIPNSSERTLDAQEEGNGDTEWLLDSSLPHAPIQLREGSIRRDIDTSNIPNLSGCLRNEPLDRDPRSGCGGCGGCPGGGASPSNLSASGQVLALLVALAALIAVGAMLRQVWLRRAYPTHSAVLEHELLGEARALSPTAIDDALAANDYNAAVHAIFLRTLLRLNNTGHSILKGWTPREIPRQIALPPEMREQLSALVLLAEHARFADHKSSEEEFELAERTAAFIDAYLDQEHA